ncbi:unnamed protein product [marine sediment metagenome]|uniref:Uncharacterized protein n=1 Tax=marine sediment metagenome TaxID=412755 RepID=X1H722_9ZZZZ
MDKNKLDKKILKFAFDDYEICYYANYIRKKSLYSKNKLFY